MAGFAAHAVLRQETRPTRPRRSGMASQAGRRGSRIAQPQSRRDLLPPLAVQHGKGPAMRAARRRRLLPAHQFVLADDLAVALHPAMTGGPRAGGAAHIGPRRGSRSEEHTSELQSLMRNSYAVFCLVTQQTSTNI